MKILYKVFMFYGLLGLIINNSISNDLLDTNIISSFPTPGPSPQGLAWDGEFLYLSDDSTDTIYKIHPNDGHVIIAFPSPGPEPRGLTSDTTHIWSLDDSLRCIYQLNKETGAIIDSLSFPTEVNYLPTAEFPFHGLTWDGQYLWISFMAGWSSTVIQVNPDNGEVMNSFFCDAEGMAFDGTFLWNVDSQNGHYKGFVIKRELITGKEIAWFRTTGYYPTGLTFDGLQLWLSDCGSDSIYQIQVITTKVDHNEDNTILTKLNILNQNYPNPFNLSTKIRFTLSKSGFVTLKIYDLIGNELEILVKEYKQASDYELTWNAKDLPSGIYLYRLEAGDFVETKKLILQR